MKKLILALLAATMMSACANEKDIDGKHYETYGLLNKDEVRDPNIKYRLVKGNVFWGIALSETIAAPIYFFGFSLYEPVGKK